jgi:hypothetical protein
MTWLLLISFVVFAFSYLQLRGDLSGLPPVLVPVSEAEMLLDDARCCVAYDKVAEFLTGVEGRSEERQAA